ncbi:MAG: alanine dehydrogenase [Porticoccaceae bacterium]|nr:alanine dehydrogenase [Porticoccaceae bacterium]
MLIGVPKEIKNHEYRVGLTPAGVSELVARGHRVMIEGGGGVGVGLDDAEYLAAGADIVASANEVFTRAEMLIKVKEPQPHECKMLRPGQLLFTYLHLAPDPRQTELLVQSGVSAIAYETITDDRGGLPLLAPMSEVAGRLSAQQGAHCLQKAQGGAGILLGGVPGVAAAHVCILGGGVVGLNAARVAMGLGANVTILDRSLPRLRYIDEIYGDRINTLFSTAQAIREQAILADLVIGAILVPGAAATKLLTRDMLKLMKPRSVVVDVAIDQGGCFETSRPTTHDEPTYIVDNIIHYCVANMPGAVARTSTFALTNATLPFVMKLADFGLQALTSDVHLLAGLNVHRGLVTFKAVSDTLGYDYVDPLAAINTQI